MLLFGKLKFFFSPLSFLLSNKKYDFRRLLTESPLVEGHWSPRLDANFSDRISEVKESMVGALLWPVNFLKYIKIYN